MLVDPAVETSFSSFIGNLSESHYRDGAVRVGPAGPDSREAKSADGGRRTYV